MARDTPLSDLSHLAVTLVLALLVAISLLVCGEALVTGGGSGDSLPAPFQAQGKPAIFTVLLAAGVALISAGRGQAR